jgi:hypothetical protein
MRWDFLCSGPDSSLISYKNMKKIRVFEIAMVSLFVVVFVPPPLSFFEPNFTGVAVNLMTLTDTRTVTCGRKKIRVSHGMIFHLKFAFRHYDDFLHAFPFHRMMVIFSALT